jgi:hypothetical protein
MIRRDLDELTFPDAESFRREGVDLYPRTPCNLGYGIGKLL